MRTQPLLAGLAAVVALTAGAIPSLSSAAPTARPHVSGDPSILAGHGEVAFVSAHRLYLIGGAAGDLQRVPLDGQASDPIWSADNHWLAVRTAPAPPKGSPYDTQPATLWLVSAKGDVVRRLSPHGVGVTEAQWSPTADRLVVVTSKGGASSTDERASIVNVGGASRTLAVASDIAGVAWSPDGHHVAVSVNRFGKGWVSRLVEYPSSAAAGRLVTRLKGSVLELAGWWPDGTALLAWVDPQGSGSLAADGLPLDVIPLATGKPHQIAKGMLTHSSWIAVSSSRNEIAIIAGLDRELTSAHKHVAICTLESCRAVRQPKHQVSFDPTWSLGGRLVAVRDRAVKPGPFGPGYVRRVQDSGGLARLTVTTAQRLTVAPRGSTAPQFGRDGSLLVVRHDMLWLVGHKSREVGGPLTLDQHSTYYGFVPWLTAVAWTEAIPGGVAGTS